MPKKQTESPVLPAPVLPLDEVVAVSLWPGERVCPGCTAVQYVSPSGERHRFDRSQQPAPLAASLPRREALKLRDEGYEVGGLD